MRLPCIVKIRVEVEELAPGEVQVVNVLVDLFAHVEEVLPGHRVVDHSSAARFLVALSTEER